MNDKPARGRVLVIEDKPRTLTFLRFLLETEGYDVIGVADSTLARGVRKVPLEPIERGLELIGYYQPASHGGHIREIQSLGPRATRAIGVVGPGGQVGGRTADRPRIAVLDGREIGPSASLPGRCPHPDGPTGELIPRIGRGDDPAFVLAPYELPDVVDFTPPGIVNRSWHRGWLPRNTLTQVGEAEDLAQCVLYPSNLLVTEFKPRFPEVFLRDCNQVAWERLERWEFRNDRKQQRRLRRRKPKWHHSDFLRPGVPVIVSQDERGVGVPGATNSSVGNATTKRH